MGRPAKKLRPEKDADSSDKDVADASNVLRFSRPTPVVPPPNEGDVLKKELDSIKNERERLLEKLRRLDLMEENINEERGGANIRDLIRTCGEEFWRKTDRTLRYADLHDDINTELKKCQNCDQDKVSSILFIFGISGSDLDLESIDVKKLDLQNPRDLAVFKDLKVFLNSKTRKVIDIINRTLEGDYKNIVQNRITLIEKALDDMGFPGRKSEKKLAA